MVGDAQAHAGGPAGPVQGEQDLLGRTRPDLLRKGGELHLKEGDAHRGGQMEDRPARGRMDKADEGAPVVAMLHWRDGTLAVETPDLVQDRLAADPVLVDRPEFDLGVRESRGDRPQQRPHVFLKVSCCARSAKTWRGRGLRRLPSRRTRYAQPRYTLTGRPSFWLIQAATVRPSQ